MKREHDLRYASMLILVSLAGCSTSKTALDLAGRGAVTVSQAESSLRDYLAATRAQLDSRSQILASGLATLENERFRREREAFLGKSAGREEPKVAEIVTKLTPTLVDIRKRQRAALAEIVGDNAFDVSSMAKVPAEKLAEAKKSFAVLSEELSSREWITIIGGYAKTISDGINEAKETAQKRKDKGDGK